MVGSDIDPRGTNRDSIVDRGSSTPITLDDLYASSVQLQLMQDSDDESRRNAVYLPTTLHLGGLDALLPQDCTSSASLPSLASESSGPQTGDVIEKIKSQENILHNTVRKSRFFTGDFKAMADSGAVLPAPQGTSRVDLSASSRLSSLETVADRELGFQDHSRSEPRVRFSSLLTEEKQRAVSTELLRVRSMLIREVNRW